MECIKSSKIEPLYPQGPQLVSFKDRASSLGQSLVSTAAEDSACQINIRCTQPGADGEMKVTLEYTGDLDLCSFLISRAQEIIEEQSQE